MDIFDFFKIPAKAIPQLSNNNKLPIKTLIDNANLNGIDKKNIEKSISSIFIRGIFDEDSTSIWKYQDDVYDYSAIYFFEIHLKTDDVIFQVNEIIHKAFQIPCVVIYVYNKKYAIGTALKRINQNDVDKNVIIEIQLSDFFEIDESHKQLLSNYSLNRENLKDFYENINNIVSAEEIIRLTNICPAVINESIKLVADQVKNNSSMIKELEQKYKEADSMQEKMRIHLEIKNIKQKMEDLLWKN